MSVTLDAERRTLAASFFYSPILPVDLAELGDRGFTVRAPVGLRLGNAIAVDDFDGDGFDDVLASACWISPDETGLEVDGWMPGSGAGSPRPEISTRCCLVESFGLTAARAVLTQFGFAHGWRMAEAIRGQLGWRAEPPKTGEAPGEVAVRGQADAQALWLAASPRSAASRRTTRSLFSEKDSFRRGT